MKGKTVIVSEEITEIIKKHQGAGRDALIPIMQAIQESSGYLSRESINYLSSVLQIPSSKIYGVATFYNQFRFQPLGKYHIQICRGTACHVKGSAAVLETLKKELRIDSQQTTRDGLFSLEIVACMGACGLAPVMCINGEFYSGISPKKARDLLNTLRRKAEEHAPAK